MAAGATLTGPTRLSVPAQAAYELDSLGKALGSLAERLGHPTCLSGDMCVAQFSDVLDGMAAEARPAGVAAA